MMRVVLLFLAMVWGGAEALAFPVAPFDALQVDPWMQIQGKESAKKGQSAYDFNGIVALSNCSGSIVRFSGQPETSQAYVLTNGHCINSWGGFLKPGEVAYREPSNRRIKVFKSPQSQIRSKTNELVYATMTDTDSALYRINATYEELEAQGVDSFEMASRPPMISQDIEVVSGYWKRGYSCFVDAFAFRLKEGEWTFKDSIRYSESGCEVIGGTSGSPIIAKGDRTVVGVNNTTNVNGDFCTIHNPCEIDEDGETRVIEGRGYGQQTYIFYGCLTVDFEIDLELASCELPKP